MHLRLRTLFTGLVFLCELFPLSARDLIPTLKVKFDARGDALAVIENGRGPQPLTLGAALASALHCTPGQESFRNTIRGYWNWQAHCRGALTRESLVVSGTVDLAPFLDAFFSSKSSHEIFVIVRGLGPELVSARAPDWKAMPLRHTVRYSFSAYDEDPLPRPIPLTFGYRSNDLAPILLIFLVTSLTPPLAAYLLRRRGGASFGNAVLTIAIWVASTIIWFACTLRMNEVIGFFYGEDAAAQAALIAALTCWPSVSAAVVLFLVWRSRLSGVLFWACLCLLLPAALLNAGSEAILSSSAGIGLVLFLASPLALVLVQRRVVRAFTADAVPLAEGSVRDRILALADRTKLKVAQVLVSAHGMRLGRRLYLPEAFTQQLPAREIDAAAVRLLVGQHGLRSFVPILLLIGLAMFSFLQTPSLVFMEIAFVLASIAVCLAVLFMARQREARADIEAARVVSDPEALIAGIGRAAGMNETPLQWDSLTAILAPSQAPLQRGEAIGRALGVAPERVHELLENPDSL